jgi:thiosulfate/3-mercaptopyruvate sulfurtransferase
MHPLVSPEQLAAILAGQGAPPALLDVRWRLGGPPGIDAYLAGHLPGACFVDLDADLAGPPGAGGRHPLPDPAAFEAAMRRSGLRAGQFAVCYDDAGGLVAARLWWLLRYFGHEQVAVLDGGYRAWQTAGLPVTTEVPDPAPGDWQPAGAGGMPVLDSAAAARLARAGVLLDARAGERYRGEVEPVDPRAGHIPGAVSAPTTGNLGADGRFLDPAELARRFATLGVAGSGQAVRQPSAAPQVGAYCGSGVNAAHEVLALELAGVPAALYVGSWSAWSADPERPVAIGAGRG